MFHTCLFLMKHLCLQILLQSWLSAQRGTGKVCERISRLLYRMNTCVWRLCAYSLKQNSVIIFEKKHTYFIVLFHLYFYGEIVRIFSKYFFLKQRLKVRTPFSVTYSAFFVSGHICQPRGSETTEKVRNFTLFPFIFHFLFFIDNKLND